MHGSAEFFAPLMATVPCSGFPPLIRNLSMRSHSPKACRKFPFAKASRARALFASMPFSTSLAPRASRVPIDAKRVRRPDRSRAAGFRQNAQAALAKFLICQCHVDHQVVVYVPQAHHRRSGEHVQDQFLRGAGLQPRRAGNHFRSYFRGDHDLRVPRDGGVAIRSDRPRLSRRVYAQRPAR